MLRRIIILPIVRLHVGQGARLMDGQRRWRGRCSRWDARKVEKDKRTTVSGIRVRYTEGAQLMIGPLFSHGGAAVGWGPHEIRAGHLREMPDSSSPWTRVSFVRMAGSCSVMPLLSRRASSFTPGPSSAWRSTMRRARSPRVVCASSYQDRLLHVK